MASYLFYQFFSSCNDSCLRSAQQFVAAKDNERHSCLHALTNGRLLNSKFRKVKQATGAQVFNERKARFPAERDEFRQIWLVRKTRHLKVRRMNAHQNASVVRNRFLVVVKLRS